MPKPRIMVDADALRELQAAVLERHGRLHGVLSKEASEALRERAKHLRGG